MTADWRALCRRPSRCVDRDAQSALAGDFVAPPYLANEPAGRRRYQNLRGLEAGGQQSPRRDSALQQGLLERRDLRRAHRILTAIFRSSSSCTGTILRI